MPIDSTLLTRLKENDPTLNELDLRVPPTLTGSDMQHLVEALIGNTILTMLDVSYNQIGAEGAKFLATNTTLTTLYVTGNDIGAEGAKALATNTTLTNLAVDYNHIGDEGAKALATNRTLTRLDIRENRIGAEGAKALAANTTLITLEIESNQIGDEWENKLKEVIANNQWQVKVQRTQFLRTLIVLTTDQANPVSQSYWAKLPREIRLHIISLIKFTPGESIGKSTHQIYTCAKFMFNHAHELKSTLQAAIKTQQNFKVLENSTLERFQFFLPKPTLSSDGAVLEKSIKQLNSTSNN